MKNVERKKGRGGVLATSIAQIVVGRKTRRERAGAGERASCAGGREAVNGRKRPVHGPSSSSPEASAPARRRALCSPGDLQPFLPHVSASSR